MSNCARCGFDLSRDYYDPDNKMTDCPVQVDCLNRQLSNLRSLLRSVTGKLEEAAEVLTETDNDTAAVIRALPLIHQVLEALS